MPSISRVKPMREDYPMTPRTIADALQYQAEARDKAKAECGIDFTPDGRAVLPARVLTFAQKEADALFIAPSAGARVHAMQAYESTRAADLAVQLAPLAYGQDIGTLTARQRAFCLYAATYALRAQDDHWTHAAHHAATEAAETWMQTEGGATFRSLSDEHRHALAVPLASAVICAFINLLEGSKHIAPGTYLRIVEGGE